MESNFWFALSLTAIAGVSTGIGGLLVLFMKQTNKKILSFSLGLSAGVMIYVSFVEILSKAVDALVPIYGEKQGNVFAVLGFFSGIAVIALIDKLIPTQQSQPRNLVQSTTKTNEETDKTKLMRMGVFTALAITIHNFPEGLATFISALSDPQMGIAITTAIAIHNIPEGIAVAVPLFYATNSRVKAFKYSFLSGLSEPVGAIIGYFLFIRFLGDEAFGFVFAGVAGIMVYISLNELLPSSRQYGDYQLSLWGLVSGMGVMAVSLLAFI